VEKAFWTDARIPISNINKKPICCSIERDFGDKKKETQIWAFILEKVFAKHFY